MLYHMHAKVSAPLLIYPSSALYCASILALVANIKIYSTRSLSAPIEVPVPHPWPDYFTQDAAIASVAASQCVYPISILATDARSHGGGGSRGGRALHDINAGFYDSMMDTEDSHGLAEDSYQPLTAGSYSYGGYNHTPNPDQTAGSSMLSRLDFGMFYSRKYAEVLLQDAEPVQLLESSSEEMWNKYPIESHSQLPGERTSSTSNSMGADVVRASKLSDLSINPDIFNVNSGYTTVDSDGEDDGK